MWAWFKSGGHSNGGKVLHGTSSSRTFKGFPRMRGELANDERMCFVVDEGRKGSGYIIEGCASGRIPHSSAMRSWSIGATLLSWLFITASLTAGGCPPVWCMLARLRWLFTFARLVSPPFSETAVSQGLCSAGVTCSECQDAETRAPRL